MRKLILVTVIALSAINGGNASATPSRTDSVIETSVTPDVSRSGSHRSFRGERHARRGGWHRHR